MDTRTGDLVATEEIQSMPPEEQKHFVRVQRDLTVQEQNAKQIKMYSPCGCGSGKKFKFCCKK